MTITTPPDDGQLRLLSQPWSSIRPRTFHHRSSEDAGFGAAGHRPGCLLVGVDLGTAAGSTKKGPRAATVTAPAQTVVQTMPGPTKAKTVVRNLPGATKTVTVQAPTTPPATPSGGGGGQVYSGNGDRALGRVLCNAHGHGEAVNELVFGQLVRAVSDVAFATARVPMPGPLSDPPEQIRALGELRDAGVLTDSEFQAKKSNLPRASDG
jgi:hypothetical protein